MQMTPLERGGACSGVVGQNSPSRSETIFGTPRCAPRQSTFRSNCHFLPLRFSAIMLPQEGHRQQQRRFLGTRGVTGTAQLGIGGGVFRVNSLQSPVQRRCHFLPLGLFVIPVQYIGGKHRQVEIHGTRGVTAFIQRFFGEKWGGARNFLLYHQVTPASREMDCSDSSLLLAPITPPPPL